MNIPLTLILGSHSHVPWGTGDEEIEYFYAKKLRPFITALNKFPKIQVALHHSGVLLQWLDKAHPEYISLLENLITRKQVELLGGAFYEPILPLLPLTDKLGQIEFMTTYIRKEFGKRPQGCWLPALAWDQSLAGVLHNSGMGYTFLREEQFARSYLPGEALYVPHITEDQGKIITVFPISGRGAADFTVGKFVKTLERLAREVPPGEKRVLTVFPDQRFGNGDETEAALCRLFDEISQCESFVEFATPAKIYKSRRELTKVYFPDSFEGEPAEDSSGAEIRVDFYPRQFLITYPEANGIYAKMMFTNALINQLRGDKSRKRSARETLWKAQGLDAFFRTPGGGIYRSAIRTAAYRALLGAEKITREKGVFIPSLMILDFDYDGEDEYLFQDERVNCYVKTRGAGIFELDYLPKPWNYLAAFENRDAVPGRKTCFQRTAFADFLSPPDFPPESLVFTPVSGGPHDFSGRCCAGERYEVPETDKSHKKVRFRLPPNGEAPFGLVEIEKTYHLKKDTLSVAYLLTNHGSEAIRFNFIPRIDLAFPGEGENYQRILKAGAEAALPGSEGVIPDAGAVEFQDLKNEVCLTLEADRNFDLYVKPIRVSCSVYGREAPFYQSTCMLPVSPVSLAPGASWKTGYRLKVSHR